MNKKRRMRLGAANRLLQESLDIIMDVRDEEETCLDNMPENLQYAPQYIEMEEAVEWIDEAIDAVENAQVSLSNLTSV